jgi:hypothetical protein
LTLLAPGRYWVDAAGNFGFEGRPVLVNLMDLARASQEQVIDRHRVFAPGEFSGLVQSGYRVR